MNENVALYDVIPALDTRGACALLHSFRAHVETASHCGFDWRAVVDSLRPETERYGNAWR
jgi:uncharacterized NAD(P)/FAD-binding protein YdhS